MKKIKCDSCGNDENFIIEGRVHIDGSGNYRTEEWDYEHGSPLRCGKCVEPISPENVPEDLVITGGPLDGYSVWNLNPE